MLATFPLKRYCFGALLLIASARVHGAPINEYGKSFKSVPQESHRLFHGNALDSFYGPYKKGAGQKAFAHSGSGAWGFVTERESAQQARTDALEKCQHYNQKHQKLAPCKVLHVNDAWQHDDTSIDEILASLPNWQPTDKEEIKGLLRAISDDIRDQRYPLALAKQLWYHHRVLEHNPNASAVRLSFGLGRWKELGNKYPPAKILLNTYSYNLLQRAKAETFDVFPRVHELVAIDRTFRRENRSVQLFLTIHNSDEALAKKYFGVFSEALLKRKMYKLYAQYVEPEVAYTSAYTGYLSAMAHYSTDSYAGRDDLHRLEQGALERYTRKVGNLIAVLTVNNRHDEAKRLADKALKDLELTAVKEVVRAALNGTFPET